MVIPRSLSASAVVVADGCLSRWVAENDVRGRGIERSFTQTGTACHNALEPYVKACYIDKTKEPSFELLMSFYEVSFMQTYQSSDFKRAEFKDGKALLKAWFERTDFSTFEVISVEERKQFQLKTKAGEIPFTYIIDRLDKLGPGVYRVTDYKTNAFGLSAEGLRDKIQARVYALAIMLTHPDATEIWVEFDMLRHEGPVGTVFTVEDCRDTWSFLRSIAHRIIDLPDTKSAPETLNPECGFCVKKTTCKALLRNVQAGGVFSVEVPEHIERRAQLKMQEKAIKDAIKEMDEVILADAKVSDTLRYEGMENDLVITSRAMRYVDADLVAELIGPDLFRTFGSRNITMERIDSLLDGEELEDQKKKALQALIYRTKGVPFLAARKKPSVKKRSA